MTMWFRFAIILVIGLCAASPARGQSVADLPPKPSISSSLPGNGDPYGTRAWLAQHGVVFGVVLTEDVFSNLQGGLRRKTITSGKLETIIGVDLEKLAGLPGLTAYANIFQLHGSTGPDRELVGNLNTISNIEALPTTRLSEIWLEQSFWDGKAFLRAGQLVVDTEFLFSRYFSYFISSDWPTNPAVNIPSGGAAYPLSTPGIRLKIDPTPQTTFLVSVLNGDPAGPGLNDPELRNRYGLNFRVKDPPYVIAEGQYRYNESPKATGLAGGIRLGGWHHFGRFDDQRFDTNGFSLANPFSSGIARRFRGNSGVYAVVDQQLYRPQGGDANSGILLFGRVSASPGDRNLSDFYADGGVIFNGLIPARPDDAFGVSFLYTHISPSVRGFDADTLLFSNVPTPLRRYELSFEANYSVAIVPGWTVQPMFAFVKNPGGNIQNPLSPIPGERIKDATLIGARSVIKY